MSSEMQDKDISDKTEKNNVNIPKRIVKKKQITKSIPEVNDITEKRKWQFFEWLKGNKESAKLVISGLFGLWIPTNIELKIVAGTILKLLLDTIDFYTNKNGR
jgi:hypothetical protein